MSTLKKRDGWEQRLVALGNELAGKPFRWGSYDCTLVAARAFDALTCPAGSGLARAYGGRWSNRAGALRFQRRYSITPERVLRESGCVEVDPAFAQRGDFLCAQDSPLSGVHVVFGDKALSAVPGKPGQVGWALMSVLMRWPGAVCLRVPD